MLAAIKEKPVDVPHVVPHPPVSQVLEVGSMVQFGNPVQYGVIKVIRKETYSSSKFAEIETVSILCFYLAIVFNFSYQITTVPTYV